FSWSSTWPSFFGACRSSFFFIERGVQQSLSLVDREVEFVPTIKSLSTVGCCARKKSQIDRVTAPRFGRTTQPSEGFEVGPSFRAQPISICINAFSTPFNSPTL
ncbi:unnamed protein product, partial [Sphacelaria rigidula]